MTENGKNTGKQNQYDMYLIERPAEKGINAAEISEILRRLSSSDVYPVEIKCLEGDRGAVGFITAEAAKSLNYKFREKTRIGTFIQALIDNPALHSSRNEYEFEDISIYFSR